MASRALRSAEVDARSGLISLLWKDGLRRVFHPLWLRDNDPTRRHPGTRQRLFSAIDLPRGVQATAAEASDAVLRVQWEPAHASSFCAAWLRSHGTDVGTVEPRSSAAAHDEDAVAAAARALPAPSVTRMPFDELISGGDAARWRWLRALADEGAVLLEGVPERVCRDGTAATPAGSAAAARDECAESVPGVRFVAELIGPMQPNIYGDIFDVVSKGDAAENLAYTSEAIGPHMDLSADPRPHPSLSTLKLHPHPSPSDPHPHRRRHRGHRAAHEPVRRTTHAKPRSAPPLPSPPLPSSPLLSPPLPSSARLASPLLSRLRRVCAMPPSRRCYYESPPGLQLLHCLTFDQDVVGGGSLLIDAFAAAEAVSDATRLDST
jgi:hypothetical protein